ncbi:synaptonemal complex protein 3-like [Bolinopsis microptera]|uniref:synaptonemal complex protein 3-like n=1 Tax=Bolinopsis microptera TaxID=2820187 RepID=UPI003078D61F
MAPTNKRVKKPEAEEKRAKEEEETIDHHTDNDENDDLNLESQNLDSPDDMSAFLNMMQTNLAQKTGAKRKRSEQFLHASVKVSSKKMEDIVHRQGTERRKLQEQYQVQVDTLIHTWEGEIEKSKEMEEKLANTFRTQQKFYTTLRVNQVKILNDLKNLAKQYNTASEELDKLHTNQQGDLPGELKREVSMLHKKFLMESHNAEVAKMKKNMQQIISASF